MYIARVPNRKSRPAILLRESYREGGKVCTRTIANLTNWPPERIIAMDIRGVDDIFILDLAAPPTLNKILLYPDPIETNSGTADLAGCSKLEPQ